MLRPGSKADKLDGRIRDIDRELRELRKAMRDLERTGRTDYVAPVPRIRRTPTAPAATASAGTASAAPKAAPAPESPAAAPEIPAAAAAPIEYFETGTSEAVRGAGEPYPLPYPPWRRPAPSPGASSTAEPLAADDKRRFANYFSSGFLPGRPLKGERHTQRNRAIAMIVVVVVLAYVLYRLIF